MSVRVAGVELALGPGDVLLAGDGERARRAWEAVKQLRDTGRSPRGEPCLWPRLPFVDPAHPNTQEAIDDLDVWARKMKRADVLAGFGAAGSTLGNTVLRDAILGPGWSARPREQRNDRPELHFVETPAGATALVAHAAALARSQPAVRVESIALAGCEGAAETESGLASFRAAVAQLPGVTEGFTAFRVPVPGPWSVLSLSGLATAAASGINARAILVGASEVARALDGAQGDPAKDPALLAAILRVRHGPGSLVASAERLASVVEWYALLRAAALGARSPSGGAAWTLDVAEEERAQGRTRATLTIDRVDARQIGGLLYFLMASTAYEGELRGA